MHKHVVFCPMVQVKTNKRYAGAGKYTVSEAAERVKADTGNIDILVRKWEMGRSRAGRGERARSFCPHIVNHKCHAMGAARPKAVQLYISFV